MRVIYYDHTDKLRHGNVEPADSLDELLAKADVVTLHVPETPATQGMIGAREIARMKKGAIFINNARGTVVDLDALAAALKAKALSGAAVDVFPVEPSSNAEKFASPLQGLDNVILTPHVGGSTEEAQERIGAEVARKFVEYSDVGSTTGAVNFPQVQLPPRPAGTRFIQVQRNLPGELGRLNEVFARHKVNIAAQHYQTDGELGYVVLDADGQVRRCRGHRAARSASCPAPSAPACCIGGRETQKAPGSLPRPRSNLARLRGSDRAVDPVGQLLLLHQRADALGRNLAVLEDHQRRHGLDVILLRDRRVGVDVELDDLHLALHLASRPAPAPAPWPCTARTSRRRNRRAPARTTAARPSRSLRPRRRRSLQALEVSLWARPGGRGNVSGGT